MQKEKVLYIQESAKKMGVAISFEQAETLDLYIHQLLKWNKTYNLTALKTYDDILKLHIFDSLSIIPALWERFDQTQKVSILDVGSGAGLPGFVLGVVCPNWSICCVDAVQKKTTFIKQVATLLKQPNIHSEHIRIEDKPPAQADCVISRAFSSLDKFVEIAGFHSKQYMVSMKSQSIYEEKDVLEAQTDWFVKDIQSIEVSDLEAVRYLVWLEKKK